MLVLDCWVDISFNLVEEFFLNDLLQIVLSNAYATTINFLNSERFDINSYGLRPIMTNLIYHISQQIHPYNRMCNYYGLEFASINAGFKKETDSIDRIDCVSAWLWMDVSSNICLDCGDAVTFVFLSLMGKKISDFELESVDIVDYPIQMSLSWKWMEVAIQNFYRCFFFISLFSISIFEKQRNQFMAFLL